MPLRDSLRFVTFSSPYPPQQRLSKGSVWDIVVAKRTNYQPISVRLHMCLRSSLRLLCKLALKGNKCLSGKLACEQQNSKKIETFCLTYMYLLASPSRLLTGKLRDVRGWVVQRSAVVQVWKTHNWLKDSVNSRSHLPETPWMPCEVYTT